MMNLVLVLVLGLIQPNLAWWLWGDEEKVEEPSPVLDLNFESQDSSTHLAPGPFSTLGLDSSPDIDGALDLETADLSDKIGKDEDKNSINFTNPGFPVSN